MERIPLVYIASNGRSGSTLLDLLLGAHPDLWTVGEIHFLPWELKLNSRPCGCGEPVDACPFWRRVVAEVPIGEGRYPIEHFLNPKGGGKPLRWELLPGVLRHGRPPAELQNAVDEYGERNARIFEVVRREAERVRGTAPRWIVDASKDAYRLSWLRASGRFDLRVIHIVKDPRAFVYSMVKRRPPTRWARVFRYSMKWIVENTMIDRLTAEAFLPDEVRRIRYEDFATEPERHLSELCAWLGLPPLAGLEEAFRRYENHAVGGNPMRWESSEIRLDTQWVEGLTGMQKDAVWSVTTPVRWRMGYPRR